MNEYIDEWVLTEASRAVVSLYEHVQRHTSPPHNGHPEQHSNHHPQKHSNHTTHTNTCITPTPCTNTTTPTIPTPQHPPRTKQSLTKLASSHSDTNFLPVFNMLAWISVHIIIVLSIRPVTRAVVMPNAKKTPLDAMSTLIVNWRKPLTVWGGRCTYKCV